MRRLRELISPLIVLAISCIPIILVHLDPEKKDFWINSILFFVFLGVGIAGFVFRRLYPKPRKNFTYKPSEKYILVHLNNTLPIILLKSGQVITLAITKDKWLYILYVDLKQNEVMAVIANGATVKLGKEEVSITKQRKGYKLQWDEGEPWIPES